MKEQGTFDDFNKAQKRCMTFLEKGDKSGKKLTALIDSAFAACFPKICKLLTETTAFYEENFGQLQSHIKREKRKLEFDTPNRVVVTHEYTLRDAQGLKTGQYFLFNTTSRLAWLKIFEEGKHICIASRQEVCQLLKSVIAKEVEELSSKLQISEDELLNLLYETSDGKPCFICFEETKINSPLLRVEYYDSLKAKEPKGCSCYNPVIEKTIEYNYRPVHGDCSCWLYVKAPKDFHIKVRPEKEIETTNSPDNEIYTGVWNCSGERESLGFEFDIKVPKSLNLWYMGIYYISLLVVLFVGFLLVSNLFGLRELWMNRVINGIPKGIYALVAALITTRGWLMREEYVLGKLSKAFTILTFALILEAIGLSACDTTAKEENEAVDALVVPKEKSDSTKTVCILDEIIENKNSAIEIGNVDTGEGDEK